ncbi:hypothetical protein [Stappia sp.]|uniref:hypothetical protein n=1 Tax=Stappia sp. TaxID=1870903 RepID=UPI003D09C9DE
MSAPRSSAAFENGLPLPYAGLPHVDDVERFDPAGDAPLFSAIADILIDEGLEDTFGVNLLHVHFTLAEGETVWESHDRRANSLSVTVCARGSALSREGRPTSWRCLDGRWLPLAFARHGLGEVELARAAPAMERIGHLLEEAGQAGRFGLCLARGGLRSWPLRIHVERTDETGRRQILAPEWAPLRDRGQDLDTSWTFHPSLLARTGIVRNTGTRCRSKCKTTCLIGSVHGPWHEKEHKKEV